MFARSRRTDCAWFGRCGRRERDGNLTEHSRTGHVDALDGIRGLAIAVVLIFHYAVFLPTSASERAVSQAIEFGWLGVDLFFCLSGFLITGILLRTLESPSYFRTFYARRALRIFPVYYAYLALTVLSVVIAHHLGYYRHTSADGQLWDWIYLSNWRQSGLPGTSHLWSLAVEEQFYLVWPLAILVFRRHVPAFCFAVALLSFVARLVAVYGFGIDGEPIHRLTPFRLDGLALGGSAAFIATRPTLLITCRRYLEPVFWLGLFTAIAVAVVWTSSIDSMPMSTLGFGALSVSFSALVLHCATSTGKLTRAFQSPALRHLGKYSYGIYVFHYALVRPRAPGLASGVVRFLWAAPAAYLLARISWFLIEQPFLRIKRKVSYSRPSQSASVGSP